MAGIKSLLAFVARASWIAVSRFLFFCLAGLLLNVLLFIYLPDICANAGAEVCFPLIAFGIVMLIIFPIIYCLIGYKFAIQKVIQYAYVQNKDYLYRYTVYKLTAFLDKNKTTGAAISGGSKLIERFFDKLDNMPFAVRAVLNFIKSVVPISEIVERAANGEAITPENEGKLATRIAEETDKYIHSDLLQPGFALPAIVLTANLAFFGLLHWLY